MNEATKGSAPSYNSFSLHTRSSKPSNILSVRDLRVSLARSSGIEPRPIVDCVTFHLDQGGSLGIAGESGSGKSTLVQAILGYVSPGLRATSGTVTLKGKEADIATGDGFELLRGREIVIVPQSTTGLLDPIRSLGNQFHEAMRISSPSASRQDTVRRASELLRLSGFSDPHLVFGRYPHQLSGGQNQRIALCIALLSRPDVVILDESTTGLDVVTERKVLDLVRSLQRSIGFATVVVSHDLRVLQQTCDTIAVLYRGGVVEQGPAHSVLHEPEHPYTTQLVRHYAARHEGSMTLSLSAPPGRSRQPQHPAETHSEAEPCSYIHLCPWASDVCGQTPPMTSRKGLGQVRCWNPAIRDVSHAAKPMPGPPVDSSPARTVETHTPQRRPAGSLVVRNLYADYSSRGRTVKVLNNVSFTVGPGEIVGLIGESGSGKTTVAKILVGLRTMRDGVVSYCGHDLRAAARRRPASLRRDLQIIFQDPRSALNPSKTVHEILRRRLKLFGLDRPGEDSDTIDALLDSVNLPSEVSARRPGSLSGGQQQRVAIARSLIGSPSLLVCDEILSSLDVATQDAVTALLLGLRQRMNLSMLFISHDLEQIASFASRVVVLKEGSIVEQGECTTVLKNPRHAYTRSLLTASSRSE